MWGYHLLFINTGSGNAPHCQPNPLSLHLVPWQGGGGVGAAVTRYRAPDVLWIRMTGVFTPSQILQHVCWWSRCGTACMDSCSSSAFCPGRHFFFYTISNLITFLVICFSFYSLLASLVHIFPSLCHHLLLRSSFHLHQPAPTASPLSQLSTFLSSPPWHLPKVCSGCSPSIFGCHGGPTTAATVVGDMVQQQ